MFILALGIAFMAGRKPFQDKLTPATSSRDLLLPFILAGVGIGLSVAPVTSAVMATAPLDRAGNTSGVLSTMRRVGSLVGIAILGAVLQNRIEANIRGGVLAIQGIPEAIKQRILAGMGDLDQMRMGMSAGANGMPGQAQQLLAGLSSGWFTDAINTTLLVGVVICLAGGVSAIFLRSHVRAASQEAQAARPPPRGGSTRSRRRARRAGAGRERLPGARRLPRQHLLAPAPPPAVSVGISSQQGRRAAGLARDGRELHGQAAVPGGKEWASWPRPGGRE